MPDGCVATIGTYDGVHLGHQHILARVRHEAARLKLPALVFSFEPTPAEFFGRNAPPARLTRLREKFSAFAELGLDVFFCPPFDASMERLEPDEFIDNLLVDRLHVRHLVIGDDFRFARKRSGTLEDLRRGGATHNFAVEQQESVRVDGRRVSSTRIRELLAAGQLAAAKALLGRHYRMSGRVVAGRQLGQQFGFPTANVRLGRRAAAIKGIFAVRAHGVSDRPVDGVASLGSRPTIEGNGRLLLEVHLFGFERRIYGEYIAVDFIEKLRDEEQFPSIDEMIRQMQADAEAARAALAANPD